MSIGTKPDRVALSAIVERGQREQLVELAKREDRSVSAIVRRALAHELEREPHAASTKAGAPAPVPKPRPDREDVTNKHA